MKTVIEMAREAGFGPNSSYFKPELERFAALVREDEQEKHQEPVAHPFECWSTNDGDSWFEHPADAQLLYDVLGDDPKVGDEFEVSAGWNCVTATYRIASKDGDDFEVECISHPQNDSAPVNPVKQEPVAWMWACAECGTEAEDGTDCRICGSCGYHKFYKAPKVATCVCAAKTQEKVKQEPVAWVDLTDQEKWSAYCRHVPPSDDRKYIFDAGMSAGIKLFKEKNAAPVRTKDLTDEEIRELFANEKQVYAEEGISFARAVIAAFKEKNK